MNLELVKRIADAVLYEGYILYPYRASAIKNRQRFNWGVLTPRSYSEAQRGTENWRMQTEVLVQGRPDATLDVKVRFLHLREREAYRLNRPVAEWQDGALDEARAVASLEVDGQFFPAWQEAVEREVDVAGLRPDDLLEPQRVSFIFGGSREIEPLRTAQSGFVGALVRRQQAVAGVIEIAAQSLAGTVSDAPLTRLTVSVLNATPFEHAAHATRAEALAGSFVSTHTILVSHRAEFVSLLDPPAEVAAAAAACRNVGAYPVLVGADNARDAMLASPIILYDYPAIAPESAGELFDGTEIDEILTLRIMTMTDAEKREMRSLDEHARKLLERTETLPPEQLMKLHGSLRGVHPPASEHR